MLKVRELERQLEAQVRGAVLARTQPAELRILQTRERNAEGQEEAGRQLRSSTLSCI